MPEGFYISPKVKIMHNAVLKKFNIKDFNELDTPEKRTSAFNYMEKVAKRLNKKEETT